MFGNKKLLFVVLLLVSDHASGFFVSKPNKQQNTDDDEGYFPGQYLGNIFDYITAYFDDSDEVEVENVIITCYNCTVVSNHSAMSMESTTVMTPMMPNPNLKPDKPESGAPEEGAPDESDSANAVPNNSNVNTDDDSTNPTPSS